MDGLHQKAQITSLADFGRIKLRRGSADETNVETLEIEMLIFVASLFGFAFSCRFLLKSVVAPVPIFNTSDFSKTALRVQKGYAMLAWGTMTGIFLASLIRSMIEVYFTL